MAKTLEFPNSTRSFDTDRNLIRFVGYENMNPIPFFIEASALTRSKSEFDCLAAFDAIVPSIHNAARKAHARNKKHNYILTATDF